MTAKKTTTKTTGKAAATSGTTASAAGNGRPKKEGLRGPQIRILAALAKARGPMTRKEIAAKAPCDLAWLNSWIGSHDEEVRAKNDKEFPSLLTLGYVKAEKDEDGSGKHVVVYSLSANGRKAHEKLLKASK